MRTTPFSGAVVTISDRSAAGIRPDLSGPLAADLLTDAGWSAPVTVVPDDIDRIREAVRAAIDAGARLIVTSGGTGVSARDVTPEAMDGVIQRELPGIAEEVRRRGSDKLPQALLSRGRAGIVGRTLVVNLPGSPGGVRDGVPIVLSVAAHVVSQLDGEDHA